MTARFFSRLIAIAMGLTVPLAWSEQEELCFVQKSGEVECFTIEVGGVVGGGTSGGGCGGNSQCGGNNREDIVTVNRRFEEKQNRPILQAQLTCHSLIA